MTKPSKIVFRWELMDVRDVAKGWPGGQRNATCCYMPRVSAGPRVGIAFHPARERAVGLASETSVHPIALKLGQQMITYFRI